MKLIIEIPIDLLERTKSGDYDFGDDLARNEVIANGTPYNPTGDCISREYVEGIVEELENICQNAPEEVIELLSKVKNAPTVEAFTKEDMAGAYNEGYACGGRESKRPQGEWIEKEETPASVSYYCSVCKVEGLPITPFCPWCGADMKGGAE